MAKGDRTGRRIIRRPTDDERQRYRKVLEEERAGMEANRAIGRQLLRERRELAEQISALKDIREQLGISLTELAQRTGLTVDELSRLENLPGANSTIETLRRYARALGHRIEIAVIAED
jgi:DNA-binding Xre family transcriptional regulator